MPPVTRALLIANVGMYLLQLLLGDSLIVWLALWPWGPSHVLPTGGTARWASGLSAVDFLRRSSVIRYTKEGLAKIGADVDLLAHKEGLTAHAAALRGRTLHDGGQAEDGRQQAAGGRQQAEDSRQEAAS